MNRKRKHPLETQSDSDWACGLFIMATCILCAFLVALPSMSRARFSVPSELEREPVENAATHTKLTKMPQPGEN